MIDGLIYGSGCGLLLIIAVVIGAVLDRLFGPERKPIIGPPVIGERLSEQSAAFWHREQSGSYDRDTSKKP